jgi:hypothetical protein
MGYRSKQYPLGSVYLGAITVTGANASRQAATPNTIAVALLRNASATASGATIPLTQDHCTGEVWRPVGVIVQTTTTTTVTATAFTLRKNGTNAATGGIATMGAVRTAPFSEFCPFTNYTFTAADAAGDKWDVVVSTTSSAGVVEITLVYAVITVAGISDAVTTL